MLGLDALDAGDCVGVGAELEDGRGLHRAGELGVGHLVGPVAEVARAVDPLEEVGVARPAAVDEDGLVDDVGAARASRATVSAARASRSARVLVSSEMVTTGRARVGLLLGEVRLLVLGAAAGEHVEERVVPLGPLDLAAGRGELELGEVRARGEARSGPTGSSRAHRRGSAMVPPTPGTDSAVPARYAIQSFAAPNRKRLTAVIVTRRCDR